ncbi:non-ribosomal peptide synthase domain TIGR01720/amino acid adenylation domain-containing protein, partial [Pedobacter terrae]
YLGQLDNVLKNQGTIKTADENTGQTVEPQNAGTRKIIITAMVIKGKLKMNWKYRCDLFDGQTIEKISDDYIQKIESIILHCSTRQQTKRSVSDIGMSGIASNQELDEFLEEKAFSKISAIYPLSPVQEGMLFHSLYDEHSTSYLNQFQCNIHGDLNLELFKMSWELVIQKHTILRSGFHNHGFSLPVQSVHNQVELPFKILDFTEQNHQHLLQEFLLQDRSQRFDMEKPPLMRVTIIRMHSQEHILVWTCHHIVKDGWSSGIICNEVLDFYQELLKGNTPEIKVDHFQHYIEFLKERDQHLEEVFWKKYLNGCSPATLLPFADTKSSRNNGIGEYREITCPLDGNLKMAVEKYIQKNRLTTSTLFQGIWAYLCHVYTGQQDLVFGVTVSGRPAELENAEKRVGLFINTIPFRARIEQDQKISEWLADIQIENSKCREFQYTSISNIKNWNLISNDLFDSIFVFENYPDQVNTSRDIRIEAINNHEQTNYLLTIIASGGLNPTVNFNYNSSVVDGADIQRISDHFFKILNQIVLEDFISIKDLSPITAAEQNILLQDFQGPSVIYKEDETICSMFNRQVQKEPASIALIFENQKLTYKELDIRSDQVAHLIHSRGVKGELVPIMLERSIEMIVGLLGILKSGNAYVPIDPNYPSFRINYILKDTTAKILLTDGKQHNKVSKELLGKLEICAITNDNKELKAQPFSETHSYPTANDLAYVIYTSGSTGQPKGVMIEHKNVMNRLNWGQEYFNFQKEDRFLQKTTFCFDVSVWEIFAPLIVGASLYLATSQGNKDTNYLHSFIDENKLTTVHFVPSLLDVFLLHIKKGQCNSLKRVICSGEALRQSHIRLFSEKFENTPLFNLYGPTETSIEVTSYKVQYFEKVFIGKPIINVKAYVLNVSGKIVPIGVPGELYIGGIQLARGYLNRPDLTAACFSEINDSLGRLYRTGDLVRWNNQGQLEYLDRLDNQVKIRGYRIEMNEISQILTNLKYVTQATVVHNEDHFGNKFLISYVVSENFDENNLRKALREKLPDYMVPTFIISADQIPLKENGKVDKEKLPFPNVLSTAEAEQSYPRNETEQGLLEIWQELLGRQMLDIYQDFFDIGGDSLTVLRLSSAINSKFGILIPVRLLFKITTISGIADYIETTKQHESIDDQTQYEVLDI